MKTVDSKGQHDFSNQRETEFEPGRRRTPRSEEPIELIVLLNIYCVMWATKFSWYCLWNNRWDDCTQIYWHCLTQDGNVIIETLVGLQQHSSDRLRLFLLLNLCLLGPDDSSIVSLERRQRRRMIRSNSISTLVIRDLKLSRARIETWNLKKENG